MDDPAPRNRTGKRCALDVFDPTPDGFTPHTLEQTVEAAREAVASLERLDAALHGCMTPLDLNRLSRESRHAREQAAAWVELLEQARDIIERDLPLSDSIAWVQEPEPERGPDVLWTGPSGGHLPPDWIVALRAKAADLPLDHLTTYRREVEKAEASGKLPALIRRHRSREFEKAWRASMTDEEFALLRGSDRGAGLRRHKKAFREQWKAARPETGQAADALPD